MKKGPLILAIFGAAVVAGLYFAPRTPGKEQQTDLTPGVEAAQDHDHEHEQNEPVDSVDYFLGLINSGEVPPMQGILALRDYTDRHPESAKAQLTMGLLAMRTAQWEKAIDRFERVITIKPENYQPYELLVQARLKMGDTAGARQDLQKALKGTTDDSLRVRLQGQLNTINEL